MRMQNSEGGSIVNAGNCAIGSHPLKRNTCAGHLCVLVLVSRVLGDVVLEYGQGGKPET
jgi:hypothetical protein